MVFRKSERRISSSLFVALVLATAANAIDAQSIFSASTVGIGGGSGPNAIASGDLNGDGKLDLVTADYFTDNFSALLGDGAGGFTPSLISFASPFGTQTSSMVLADVNGDRNLDLIASTFYNPGLGVLLGDGAGGFGPPTAVSLPVTTIGVQAGDFTGDGVNDLLANSYASDELDLAKANGGGSFSYTLSISFGSPFGTVLGTFAIADFNLDGNLDFASGTFYTAGFGVLLGNGSGGFGAPTLFPAGLSTDALAAGDLDGNGIPDVAVLDTGADKILLFAGDGTGSFVPVPPSLSTRPIALGIAIGDVNGDGKGDVIDSEGFADAVRVYVGSGTFAFTPVDLNTTGDDPAMMAFGDFDSDGHMDIATANATSSDVTFLKGTTPTPTGISLYGTGTSGCSGLLGMNANQQAVINTPTFGLTCTNAPANAVGLCLIGNVQDVAGSDPLALGFLLHVNLFASTFFVGLDFASDGIGAGFTALPLPNSAGLIGVTVFAQGLWVEPLSGTCSPSPIGVVTTKGLSITVF